MAVGASPTANWDTIQDVFYRREEVYQMGWNVGDLSDYLICAGRNGGPLAIIRDERKVMILGKHTPGKPKIYVFSAAGLLLSTLSWELSPPILMHLTLSHLFVLSDEGVYRLYDLSNPQTYTQHTLGSEVSDAGLVSAKAHDDGFVVLTGNLQFLEVRGWGGGRAVPLAEAGLSEAPASWTLIPPEQSSSGHVELLISVGSTVITHDALDRIDQRISRGPFSHILASPNGRFLALLTITGSLWVVSSDFSRNLSDIPLSSLTGASGIPDRVAWCGDNAIALTFAGTVVIAGPGGDSLSFDYPPFAHIYTEIDGVRILSSGVSSFVQKVPDSSLAVFSPGSSHPASILYDALDHFERKSAKADEVVRSIKADLATAVDTCVEAAGREWDAAWQRRLLRAAQFGRAFMNLYNPSDFVGMAQTLKVLNAVRYYEVGIPLTYDQFLQIGPSALIAMLLARNSHLLALRISQHLSLRPDAVLRHWASAKIARSKGIDPGERGAADDEALCAAIVDKYEREGERASFADIAKGAWQAGRVRLATMLLDHERRAEEQVPLLLEMKQERIALIKAIHSGDTDMVYHVLLHLRHTLSPGDFFHLLDDANDPQVAPALALLQVYAKQADRQLLRDFYYQDDRRVETACLELQEAGETSSVQDRLAGLKAAAKAFGEDKERSFEAKMTDDAHRLLQLQSTYEAELEHKFGFVGLSVDEFVSALIREGFSKRSERVRVDWKIPDKRWYWVKLKALTDAKDWDALEAFAKSKKSPIGYEPFVTHLLSLTPPATKQAASFVPRCDPKLRSDLYARCGEWTRAAEAAAERKDRAKLDHLLRTAPDGMAQRDIEEVMKRLK